MMPQKGASIRAEQMATRRAHRPHEVHLAGDRQPARRPARLGRAAGLRLVRGEPDPRRARATGRSRARCRRSCAPRCRAPPRSRTRCGSTRARTNDFKTFLPVLRKNLDLRKRYIDCFEVKDEPYDIVLDDYERDMTTKEVRRIFNYLKEHQAPLVKEVAARGGNDAQAARVLARGARRRSSSRSSRRSATPTTRGGSTRPCIRSRPGTGITDIRITTRYFSDHLGGLFGTMHEFGHGLYERQVDPALERSPLARGVSLGMHESQSRMWENLVGRSLPFWRHFFPRLQELFPTLAGDGRRVVVPRGEPRRAVADPGRGRRGDLQPPHHPALRARAGDARRRVPARAAARAVEQPDVGLPRDRGAVRHRGRPAGRALVGRLDRLLPDVRAREPDLGADLGADHRRPARRSRATSSRGSSAALRDWLRDHLHRLGRKYTPGETLERVVGTPEIDPEPYVRYLRSKLADIYGIAATAA